MQTARSAQTPEEARRLAAVHATELLDTEPEEAFDRLTTLAARLLRAPLAFITIVDEQRSFWKSCIGLDVSDLADRRLPVGESLCQHGIRLPGPFVVNDARDDEWTKHTTPVVTLGVAAWASVPVVAPGGEVLGSFCVGDYRPRVWTVEEVEVLETFGDAISAEIALRDAVASATALARALQATLMPAAATALPGWEVATRYRPAGDGNAVMGDMVDFCESLSGRWHVAIGDVSGHGIRAARIANLARYAIRAAGARDDPPGAILSRLNDTLLTETDLEDGFMTAVLASLGYDGSVTVASAGHPAPHVLRADGTVERIGASGIPLGFAAGWSGTSSIEHVEVGDSLVLTTDGVAEAGTSGEMLGETGLIALLAGRGNVDAETVAARIDEAVLAHAGAQPRDDAAVVVLHRIA